MGSWWEIESIKELNVIPRDDKKNLWIKKYTDENEQHMRHCKSEKKIVTWKTEQQNLSKIKYREIKDRK